MKEQLLRYAKAQLGAQKYEQLFRDSGKTRERFEAWLVDYMLDAAAEALLEMVPVW